MDFGKSFTLHNGKGSLRLGSLCLPIRTKEVNYPFLWHVWVWMCAKSCLTLCNPMDYSPPGSSVHAISQARILEWVSISYSRGSSWSRDRTHISCTGRWILYLCAWETPKILASYACVLSHSVMSNPLWPHGRPQLSRKRRNSDSLPWIFSVAVKNLPAVQEQ